MSARYRELATELQAAIDAGTYPPGSRLPSESEVAQAYGVARGTVRQAFAVLAADGLISTRKGARRMVLPQPRLQGFNELRSFSQWAHVIGEAPGDASSSWSDGSATAAEAEQLGSEQVYHLTRVRLLSGRPVMIERTTTPIASAPWSRAWTSSASRSPIVCASWVCCSRTPPTR